MSDETKYNDSTFFVGTNQYWNQIDNVYRKHDTNDLLAEMLHRTHCVK